MQAAIPGRPRNSRASSALKRSGLRADRSYSRCTSTRGLVLVLPPLECRPRSPGYLRANVPWRLRKRLRGQRQAVREATSNCTVPLLMLTCTKCNKFKWFTTNSNNKNSNDRWQQLPQQQPKDIPRVGNLSTRSLPRQLSSIRVTLFL